MIVSLPVALRSFGRALLLRCPNCGSGGILRSWFHLEQSCPRCGLNFEREEQGYVVGAYLFNIIVAELAFAAIFVGTLLLTWPHPPWRLPLTAARR
jgi:uncharacterized protein (DUF983 family)